MADAFLIETASINPYENIVSDTTNQLNSVQADIKKVSDAISNLERSNPTHYLLPKLRERLSELQIKAKNLGNTNESAKSLLTSYNDSLANANTMEGLYRLKQAELNRAQQEADRTYRDMADDVRRSGENYITALGNATASENAIINANAGLQGASMQSTAEARARNYLQNAQAQAEANANMITNINAINDSRLNSNSGYVQLSQSNADNTIRQQIMNELESQQSSSNYGSGRGYYSSGSNVTLPDTVKKDGKGGSGTSNTTTSGGTNLVYEDSEQDKKVKEDTKKLLMDIESLKYGTITGDVGLYHNNINGKVTQMDVKDPLNGSSFGNFLDSGYSKSSDNLIVDLDRKKTNKFLKEGNDKWDLGSTYVQTTHNGYLIFTDGNNNTKVAHAKDLMEGNPDKVTISKKNGNTIIR